MPQGATVGQMGSEMTLPNGAVIPNRLVKVAMVEGIGADGGLPDYRHRQLYKRWGAGGWGMIITGAPLFLTFTPRRRVTRRAGAGGALTPIKATAKSTPNISPRARTALSLRTATAPFGHTPPSARPPSLLSRLPLRRPSCSCSCPMVACSRVRQSTFHAGRGSPPWRRQSRVQTRAGAYLDGWWER